MGRTLGIIENSVIVRDLERTIENAAAEEEASKLFYYIQEVEKLIWELESRNDFDEPAKIADWKSQLEELQQNLKMKEEEGKN